MSDASVLARKVVCFVLLVACLAPMVGCVGLVANLLNVMGAGLMPAAFPELEGKKVAVVCVSNSDLFGPTSTSTDLSTRISRLLSRKVKDIQVIPNQDIEDWMDRSNWNMVDFVEIGKGVEAEMVVAVDVDALSLYDGPTMFKGRAQVHLVVYDVVSGQEVYAKSPPQIEFPSMAGIPSTSISEREFRKRFLDSVADRLARNFYAFDINEDVAKDAETISRL